MDAKTEARRRALTKRANSLKTHCRTQGLAVLDHDDRFAALEQRVIAWFAELGPEVGPIERIHCLMSLFEGEHALAPAHPITQKHARQWLLRPLGDDRVLRTNPLGKQGWPPPIHYRIKTFKGSGGKLQYGHFTGLFESFLHLHFVAVASQFLWLASARPAEPPSDLTRFGLKIVHSALIDGCCMGGTAWLNRAAGLSCAGQALIDAGQAAPCPELFGLLNPAATLPKLDFDPDPRRGQQPIRRLGPEAEVLGLWQHIRNQDYGHTDRPTAPVPPALLPGALRLKDLLGEVFGPYRDYRLAYIGVLDSGQCVIQGIWDEAGDYLGWNNLDNQPELIDLWGSPESGFIPAPPPPDPRYAWDGSLLLFHRDAPRERCLYLMPLGYRHERRATETGDPLPGLTDSVHWDKAPYSDRPRVKSIDQKDYRDLPDRDPHPDESASADAPARSGPAPDTIQEIVAFIRTRYDLDLPIPAEAAAPLPTRFELNHLPLARQLAEDALPRTAEVERVLDLARQAPTRRLLLLGPSGGGKSVLLAQVAQALGEPVIYFTMDLAPEPEPEIEPPTERSAPLQVGSGDAPGLGAVAFQGGRVLSLGDGSADRAPNKTLAVPVRMHLLASLYRLAGRGAQAPAVRLAEAEAQTQVRALLADLAEHREGPVWVLIDALNQSVEPAALLSGLPRDLPENLRVIAATQAIEPVIAAVSDAGRTPWTQTELATIGRDLTEDLALFGWPTADRARLGGHLPADLLDALHTTGVGLPLLLREWGLDLHRLWQEQGPAAFAAFRRLLAESDHRSMPPAYRRRLDQARERFDPPGLPDMLLWAMSLLARPLDLGRLHQAATALRPQFPGTRELTKADCQAALARLGGFLALSGPRLDPRWRLLHPLLGAWFIDLHGAPERLFLLRESLVPLGAGPDLDDPRSLAAWAGRALDGEPAFGDLPAPQRLGLLNRLLDGLPDGRLPLPELAGFAQRRAVLLYWHAWALHETGDKDAAMLEADAARNLAERTLTEAAAEQYPDLAEDLAGAWRAIGIIVWDAGDHDRCLYAFEQAIKLLEDIKDRFPQSLTLRLEARLARDYSNRGLTLDNLNRFEDALADYDQAIALYQGLDQDKPEVRQSLAGVHHNRGIAVARLNRRYEALADYDRAIALYQGLDQNQPEVRCGLAGVHHNRSIALANLRRFDEALADDDRAIALYQGLDQNQPEVGQGLAGVHHNRGATLDNLERFDEALADDDRSIALYQGLDQDQPEVRRNLAEVHCNRGTVLTNLRRFDEALADDDRAIALYQGLDQDQPAVRQGIAGVHHIRGIALADLRRIDEALADYDRAIALYQGLDQDQPAVRQGLAGVHHNRGFALADLKRFEDALADDDRAIALYQGLNQDQPEVRRSLARVHHNRSFALANLNRRDEALADDDRAIALYQGLDQDRPAVRQGLAGVHYNRGIALYGLSQLHAAFEDLDRAIALGNTAAIALRQSPWRLWRTEGLTAPPEIYTDAMPADDRSDWQPPPLIGTGWISLTGESARPHLDSLVSLLRPFRNLDLLRRIEAGLGALRARSVPYYPGWTLCELRLDGDDGPGALPFLSGADGAALLSGLSDPLHGFNRAIGLRLAGQESYLDYCSLFCSVVRGEQGRLQLIESADCIPWRADIEPVRIAEIAAKLEPPRIVSVGEDAATLTACVLYAGCILKANFKVLANGMVEMLDDEPIAQGPVARLERFDGPIRRLPDGPSATTDADPDTQDGNPA